MGTTAAGSVSLKNNEICQTWDKKIYLLEINNVYKAI
jgi:hypothetical protein